MPFPDSEYPSILRGKDKRESQRLLSAAPELLRGCQAAAAYLIDPASEHKINRDEAARIILAAIAKAEGRSDEATTN